MHNGPVEVSDMVPHAETVPLPPATLEALTFVYHARRLSERRLASSIGTTHPHVGRIMAGKSRPSRILANRLSIALDLPLEFNDMMMDQSSNLGRKMRRDDGFDMSLAPVGDTPCPHDEAHGNLLMWRALEAAHEFESSKAFYEEHRLNAVGFVPAMGGAETVDGYALDPWHEFKTGFDSDPLIVWRGTPKAPRTLGHLTVLEFISTIPPEHVVRCSHHERR
jgi:transcriptional regulator with XRE-family HTH domain